MNLLTVWDWDGELWNGVESYLIGENEAYKISILVFFCIYKQGAREIQSAKRDLAKHQYRIRILCLDYLATLSKEWIDFLRTKTHRMIKEDKLVCHCNLTLFWMTQFGLLCCALSGSSKTSWKSLKSVAEICEFSGHTSTLLAYKFANDYKKYMVCVLNEVT